MEWLESTLFSVPWGYHMLLVDWWSGNPQKALFFARQTVENGRSRSSLLNALSSDSRKKLFMLVYGGGVKDDGVLVLTLADVKKKAPRFLGALITKDVACARTQR